MRSSKTSTLAIPLALSCLLACGGGGSRSAPGVVTSEGVVGSFFLVTVATPENGFVDSTDGQIHCGPAGSGATACGPATYLWADTATLNATPAAGFVFQSWAGDCASTGSCVLTAGADKFVVAIFALAGQVGHPNFTSPSLHGPAYLDFLGNVAGSLTCNLAGCHGPNLQGVGLAPNCFDCHAQAGWTSWQTNCSFCHGATTAQAKAGYVLSASPTLSAPPDAISQRLDGAAAPARTGAHQSHLTGVSTSGAVLAPRFRCETCHAVPTNLSHVRGSAARANVALSAAGQAQLPASLGTYDAASGTCTTYCHGVGFASSAGRSPVWGTGQIACDGCHATPPPSPHPAVTLAQCTLCHPASVLPDGTIDPAGAHLNGRIDVVAGGACDACHGFPPATGAHARHDGLTTLSGNPSGYGDVRTLQDRVLGVTPATAPAVYAFGCGNCHPLDPAHHLSGTVDIELQNPAAPAGSLKARASPAASYDRTAKTCSGTYCHSSGQEAPAFGTSPGWTSGVHLGCNGCHANPPRYDSGAPGSATANSHLNLSTDGSEYGHFLGVPGPYHPGANRHGGAVAGQDAAPITCQTCHADTTDPAAAGPSGFYWLDTTGDYQLPGGNAARLATAQYAGLQCTACHSAGSAAAPARAGRVLPLRHVNGARDVVFDPRGALGPISWLPAAPNTPAAPYWVTGASRALPWPSYVVFDGTTATFPASPFAYDPATKTCSNVACHLAERPMWGTRDGPERCSSCHPQHR